jgi:RNA polymerase sigma factor (sigma-70 family)
MPFPCSCAAAPSTESVAPEFPLLRDTQAYLALRAQGLTPSARLTTAWDRFYRLVDPVICRCVRLGHLSGPDQGDCIQEVWLEIVAHLGHFRDDPRHTHLRTWIATLARNKAMDFVREHSRHPRKDLSDRILVDLPSHEFDPAVECERHGTQALVRNALAELASQVSATSFRVLYLRSIEERTVPEVASKLGLTPEQVRFRHHRMKQKLRPLVEVLAGDTCSGGGAEPSD